MRVESQCLLASGDPKAKFIPLVSMVSVLPIYSSQNFCTDKHFILSIDPKHTLKWLAEEELPRPHFIQYLPYHKGKSLVSGNDREKGWATTSHTVQQIPVTPSFPASLVLGTFLPWGCPNCPAALIKSLGPAKGLQCKEEALLSLCYSWAAAVNATDAPLCGHLVQSHHLWHRKDPRFSQMNSLTCGKRALGNKISAFYD